MRIKNFGRNVVFTAKHFYQPHSEAEVLEILNKHSRGQIRVVGSLHAWNDGIVSDDALLDIKYLNNVQITQEGEQAYANVGAGCKLEQLIKILAAQNLTVPAMGGIMRQTVAGLASTATHGTGRSSFSHYITEIRIAAYDETTGQAKIFEYKTGPELLAARCALGCMGVVLSVKIPCVIKFWVQEHQTLLETLDQALLAEKDWPLQQFALFPHSWKFLMYSRKIVPEPGMVTKILSGFQRFLDYTLVEILPHFIIKLLLVITDGRRSAIIYFKNVLPRVVNSITTTNRDYLGLTLHTRHHYIFRHIEMEAFIPEQNLRQAYRAIREITDWFAGTSETLSLEFQEQLTKIGLLQNVLNAKGKYVLHYLMFFRKVLPDETLISMTSGNTAHYAIGFFTYYDEVDRAGYYLFTKTMAQVLNKLFDARLHWGKYFPLDNSDINRLYPKLDEFKKICKKVDPHGVFQNNYTRRVLGF